MPSRGTGLMRWCPLATIIAQIMFDFSKVTTAPQEIGSLESRGRQVFDNVVVGHESQSPECRSVICTCISHIPSVTTDVTQGKKDAQLHLQEKLLANHSQPDVGSRLNRTKAYISGMLRVEEAAHAGVTRNKPEWHEELECSEDARGLGGVVCRPPAKAACASAIVTGPDMYSTHTMERATTPLQLLPRQLCGSLHQRRCPILQKSTPVRRVAVRTVGSWR